MTSYHRFAGATVLLALLSFAVAALPTGRVLAQAEANAAAAPRTIQPTIMPLPFTTERVSNRAAFESNDLVRVAITELKSAFDERGVNTIDFRAKLDQLANQETLQEDQVYSIKDEVIRLSGADIYVEVEAKRVPSREGNSAQVLLTAFDAYSGESLANVVGQSKRFNTDDYSRLVAKAVEDVSVEFLNTIQSKFDLMLEQGRTLVLTVGLSEDADFDLDSEFGEDEDLLSDILQDWLAANAHKGYFHVQGVSDTKAVFDIVKVPLKNARGQNYRPSKFAASLRKYLKTLGLDADRTVNGSNVTMTLKRDE